MIKVKLFVPYVVILSLLFVQHQNVYSYSSWKSIMNEKKTDVLNKPNGSKIGYVNLEDVTVLDEKDGYYYIEYPLDSGGTKKGYVPKERVKAIDNKSSITKEVNAKDTSVKVTYETSKDYKSWKTMMLTSYTQVLNKPDGYKIGSVYKEEVTVLDESGQYYFIQYNLDSGGTKRGYVIKKNVSEIVNKIINSIPKSQSSKYTEWTGYSKLEKTNVLNEKFDTIIGIVSNEKISVVGENGNYYEVKYLNKNLEKIGFVLKTSISKTDEKFTKSNVWQATVNTSKTKVYADKGQNVVANLDNQDLISVLGESDDYYYIKYPYMSVGFGNGYVLKTNINKPNQMNDKSVEEKLKLLLKTSLNEKGYIEGDNNDTKYGIWYGMNNQPWCQMFVNWAAVISGIEMTSNDKKITTIPSIFKSASCDFSRKWFILQNRYGTIPKIGSIVYFNFDNSNSVVEHVGIVTSVTDNEIRTIEGNTSNYHTDRGIGVFEQRYKLSDAKIDGFGYIVSPFNFNLISN